MKLSRRTLSLFLSVLLVASIFVPLIPSAVHPAWASPGGTLTRNTYGKIYFNDFTSTDDTTKNGGTWTLDTANSQIYQSANVRGYAYVDAGQDSYVTEAKWKRSNMAGLAGVGVVMRFVDANNMYYVQEETTGSSYTIKKYVSSASTTIKSGSFSASANNWYIIAAYFNGNSKTTYIGSAGSTLGVQLTDTADTSFQTGHNTGLKGAPASGATDYFDWLLVQKSWTVTVTGMSDNWYFKVVKGANSYQSGVSASGSAALDISTLADRAPYDHVEIYDNSNVLQLDNQFAGDVYGGDAYSYSQAAVFDFSLGNSGGITVAQGGSGSNTITVTWNGVSPTQSVSLSCTAGLPSGASCVFVPVSSNPTFSAR